MDRLAPTNHLEAERPSHKLLPSQAKGGWPHSSQPHRDKWDLRPGRGKLLQLPPGHPPPNT